MNAPVIDKVPCRVPFCTLVPHQLVPFCFFLPMPLKLPESTTVSLVGMNFLFLHMFASTLASRRDRHIMVANQDLSVTDTTWKAAEGSKQWVVQTCIWKDEWSLNPPNQKRKYGYQHTMRVDLENCIHRRSAWMNERIDWILSVWLDASEAAEVAQKNVVF